MNSTIAPAAAGALLAPAAPLQFGPFVLDRQAGRLLRDGQPVDLPPKAMDVLVFLTQRAGQLATKDELLDGVWGHRFVSDSVLKVAVNVLRQALGEEAATAHWVQTVPRRGYRFNEAVTSIVNAAAAPGAAAQTVAPSALEGSAAQGNNTVPQPAVALGNLPLAVGELIGREQALAELSATMAQHRLLTLTGPGGVGKTTLALAAARLVAKQAAPQDGVWLVRLEDLDSGQAIPHAVANAIGLGDGAAESPQTLAKALAPLTLLLLLDNAEHVADGLALLVAQCLQHAPKVSILVTSQRPLQLRSEQLWPVLPLALPETSADVQAQRASPAVALMLKLVKAQQPAWQASATDVADLAAMALALDGLPLALALAAARVPLLGAAGVRQRLGARLQLLTGGRADAPARHRTLRASLEWSFALLPPLLAQVLMRVSVFVGGFTPEAAHKLLARHLPDADEWAVLEALQQLQDLALLTAQPQPPTVRLRMLDSVRLLCLEKLAQANELDSAHADHLQWLLGLFTAAEAAYLEVGVERWFAPVEAEAQNLIAAMERSLQSLPDLGRTLQTLPSETQRLAFDLASLVAASTHFCLRAGLASALVRWRERLQPCLAAPHLVWPTDLQARWCLCAARLGGQGLLSTKDALVMAEQAVALLPDSPKLLRLALYLAGLYQLRLGQREALANTLAQMRAQPSSAESSPYLRRFRPMLEASVAQADGDPAAYLAFWTDVLNESRRLGDAFDAWRAAWGVGQARYLQGDLDGAIEVMDQAIDEVRAAGRLHALAGFAGQAVFIRLARDTSAQTLARLHEVLPLLQSQGTLVSGLGDALAWVPLRQGRLQDALRVQAWMDAYVATEQVPRSHVARRLREQFAQQTSGAAPPSSGPLDDASALHLVLQAT